MELNPMLSNKAQQTIELGSGNCFVSIASIWELSIKFSIGKIELSSPPSSFKSKLAQLDIGILPVDFRHLEVLETLPLHYRDPFDRIIISQPIANNLSVVTRDPLFKSYPVNIVW